MKNDAKKVQSPACPNCGGSSVHRSMRRGLVELLSHFLLFRSPYRCPVCDSRFFRFRLQRGGVVFIRFINA
jgi:ribosomal protein L37AE/L43A